ncbi:MAG TPA: tyrosine-type recombinase/integrase [Cytophagales bacterium]|nr:tyrosine-type recombinase/integrase [Cytophagales bacterium]
MKSNKEPVRLREKKLANGQLSLYLDIYRDGQRSYEFLKMYIYPKPKNAIEKEHNKTTIELAQRIKAKRIEEINGNDFNLTPRHRGKTDFIGYYQSYYDSYTKKDARTMLSSLMQLKAFVKASTGKESIQAKDLSENVVINFKNYLEQNFNGETPQTYFNRFKKVVKSAIRDKIITISPITDDLKFKVDNGLRKEILSTEEIQKLASTPCPNSEVKRAFLFCLNTGIRHCDLIQLKWKNVDKETLRIPQSKTQKTVTINLNSNSLYLIGEKGNPDDLIFKLPTFTGSIKSIRKWAVSAEIDKKLTWHSCRHSFAVNLLIFKNDVKTISDLLGHSSMKHTDKYVRVVKSLKEEAVKSLPNINF